MEPVPGPSNSRARTSKNVLLDWLQGRKRAAPVGNEQLVAAGVESENDNQQCSEVESVRAGVQPNEDNFTETDYPDWSLYFPTTPYSATSSAVAKLRAIEGFLSRIGYKYSEIRSSCLFYIKLGEVSQDREFNGEWASFIEDLKNVPVETLAIAELAMHKLVKEFTSTAEAGDRPRKTDLLGPIRVRVLDFSSEVNLRRLAKPNWNKLVTAQGIINRVEPVVTIATWMTFRCSKCNLEQVIFQPNGRHTLPNSCKAGCSASKKNMDFLSESPTTRYESFQTVSLQQYFTSGQSEDLGQIPYSMDVELDRDLVDSLCPGDDVTLTAIVMWCTANETERKRKSNMFRNYLKAVTVRSNKNAKHGWHSGNDFSQLDIEAIEKIRTQPNVCQLLVRSLCPMIYGNDMVKAGLLLALFGGSPSETNIRSDIHVLVVGDPGTGKSQMLKACSKIAPRGSFVGTGTTNAGLTVAVRIEKNVGAILEAGALVLADQGVCCIDEFDKISAQHPSLLEAMEQQVVSVAKAGILCSVPARTSIIAMANPRGGFYDTSKSLMENVNIDKAILSRFDLVFVLIDHRDSEQDKKVCEHRRKEFSRIDAEPSDRQQMTIVPEELLQKYIAFARKNVTPLLSEEAALKLQEYYCQLRSMRQSLQHLPVTTRQFLALVRLTEARARMDLAEEATLDHAKEVIDIFSSCTKGCRKRPSLFDAI